MLAKTEMGVKGWGGTVRLGANEFRDNVDKESNYVTDTVNYFFHLVLLFLFLL